MLEWHKFSDVIKTNLLQDKFSTYFNVLSGINYSKVVLKLSCKKILEKLQSKES